jgi:RHS repeat-associated protein
MDASFGLMNYNARYYDPALGRFISPDSFIPESNKGSTFDRYAYTDNNPMTLNDPNGHAAQPPCPLCGRTLIDYSGLDLNTRSAIDVIANIGCAIVQMCHVDVPTSTIKFMSYEAWANTGVIGLGTTVIGGNSITEFAQGDEIQTANQADNLSDSLTKIDEISNDAYVCRGGTCTAERFASGSGVITNSDGTLSGVSVNSASGVSIQELTSNIPNKQVGVTTVGNIRAAGGNVIPFPLDNNPYHAIMNGLTPSIAEFLFTPTIRNPNIFN